MRQAKQHVRQNTLHKAPYRVMHKGQNLVEAVMTVPIFLILLFAVFEFGHFWQVTETAKHAAMDAVALAARNQNAGMGTTHLLNRLTQAQLMPAGPTGVTSSPDGSSYTAQVSVNFQPYFGGISIPTLAGPIDIIPAAVPIRYQEIKSVGVL